MEFKDIELKTESVSADGTFEGYGSLFGGSPDAHGDIIQKGAFKQSLSEGGRNRTGIQLLWQHNSSEIVGVWLSLIEDEKGLKVVGRLALETIRGREIYELLKLGVPLSLSIGFDTKEFSVDSKAKVRTLLRIDLWEVSLVSFPARTGAGVTSFKTALTVRSLEDQLKDLGLSVASSKYVLSLCRPSLKEDILDEDFGNYDEFDEEDLTDVLETLQELNQSLEI